MSSTQKHYLKINPYLDIISGISVVLSFSDGIIKIIGREGSGKSVLTQLLAAELVEEEQEVVIFSDIPHSETELHDPIQQQLHLNLGENSDFYSALNNHIQARPFDQQKLILVFDDADQIPEDCFEAIRVLFEKNYNERPEVSMVFAGTELLDQKLNEPKNRTFNKNIILNFEIKPMNRSELEAFCNAYLEEMGLQQKHHLSSEDLDDIFAETNGLPGKIPELIFAIFDREEEKKVAAENPVEEKNIISKLVELDDDPEPDMTGLSVEDREIVLTAFKDQVPWRWQSNGVGMAVVILFIVVAYGSLVPVEDRSNSIVIFPPPPQSPGQLSQLELTTLAESLQQEEQAALNTGGQITEPVPQEAETPDLVLDEPSVTDLESDVLVAQEEPVETSAESDETEAVVESLADLLASVAIEEDETLAEETITEETITEEIIVEETTVVDDPELVAEIPAEETLPEQELDPEPAPQPTIDEEALQQIAEVDIPAQEEPASAQEPDVNPETAAIPEPTVAEAESALDTDPATFVTNWLAAWENKNLEEYFQSYHSAFNPLGQASLESWQNDRTTKINRPANIDISIDDLEVISVDTSESIVQVTFTYISPTYADRTTKNLVLASENGDWAILAETNIAIETLAITPASSSAESPQLATSPIDTQPGESGFEAKIRQVLELVQRSADTQMNSQVGMFINDWLGAWKSQDVERYFRHYDDEFEPAYFDTRSDWRADRIRKINEKRFIDIAFDDIEVLDENENGTRIRFWLSYVSSFYLDRTLKEVVISSGRGNNDLGILQERNLEVEIIPFYP